VATSAGVARRTKTKLRLSAFRFPFCFDSFLPFVAFRPSLQQPSKSSRTARLLHRRTFQAPRWIASSLSLLAMTRFSFVVPPLARIRAARTR
jgi:hypothetical protein